MKYFGPAAIVAATLALSPAVASDPAIYAVRIHIAKNDKPIGSPALTVRGGSSASIAMSGANGYSLSMLVSPGTPDRHGPVKVAVSLTPQGADRPMKFTVITPLAKEAAMAMSSGRDNYRVAVDVTDQP